MAKQKFKVWQAGWEDEVHEVESDLEDRECPACEFVGDLPADVPTEGLDPIVVVCVGPDGVEHPRRVEFRGRVSPRLSCCNATPDDIEAARGRVAEAKAKTGVRERFYTGRSSPTRLVPVLRSSDRATCARCGLPLHIGGSTHPNAEDCIKSLKATLAGAFEAGHALRAQRDEAVEAAKVPAPMGPDGAVFAACGGCSPTDPCFGVSIDLVDALTERAGTFAACARPENGWHLDANLLTEAAAALVALRQEAKRLTQSLADARAAYDALANQGVAVARVSE